MSQHTTPAHKHAFYYVAFSQVLHLSMRQPPHLQNEYNIEMYLIDWWSLQKSLSSVLEYE